MGLERFNYEGRAVARVIALGSAITIGQDTFRSDLTRTYVQLTLLNSFPVVNKNGDTLLPPVLAKAVPTADNQPLNLEHQLSDNGDVYQGTDLFVGTMIKAYFATKGDIQMLPDTSSPVKVIAVLWNRVAEAQKIIASIGEGEKQYGISFEILFGSFGWVVFGEDGPSYETEINETLMAAYKSKQFDQVARAVGGDGSENSTHLWGGGFTLMPADEDAGIDTVLTGSFKGERALAAKISTIEPKEPTMTLAERMKAVLAKINKALAQSGFTVQVAGGDKLSLNLAGNQIDQPDDFYLSGYKRGDGTYQIFASLYLDRPGIDGFVQKVRLEYEPNDSGDFSLTEVDPATAKVKTPRELQAEIAAHVETIAGYEGFLSPTEVQAKIDEAVAAAKADPGDGDGTKDMLTPEQVDEKINDAMAARDAIEASMKSRSEQLVADGFVLTEERKTMLATFTADKAGDQGFTDWVKGLKTEQAAMIKDLESRGVEITDPIKSAVACLNSKADSGFAALMASHGAASDTPPFNPSLGAAGDDSDDPEKFARVC